MCRKPGTSCIDRQFASTYCGLEDAQLITDFKDTKSSPIS